MTFTAAGVLPRASLPVFTDVTAQSGIHFVHNNGAFGKKYLPETIGAGVLVLDVDNDGWQDLKARFENHLSAEKNLAPLTIRNYSTDLRPLTEFMEARSINRLHDLDRNMLRAYLAWLVDTGYAKSSIVRKLSVLRTFISWLLREGVIEKDPLPTRRTMKRESRLPRFLSELEVEQLLEAPDTSSELGIRDRAILEILYAAGIRVSEAHNLNMPDVNLQTREMRVRGKGSKERAVLVLSLIHI